MTPWQGPWRKVAAQAKLNGFRDKHPIKQLHSITIKLHSSLPYVWVTNHFELCRLNLVGHGGATYQISSGCRLEDSDWEFLDHPIPILATVLDQLHVKQLQTHHCKDAGCNHHLNLSKPCTRAATTVLCTPLRQDCVQDCCNFKFIRKTSKSVFQQFLALKLTSKGWLVCISTGRYLHSSYSVVPRGVFFFFPVFPRQHELDEQRTVGNHSGQ